MECIDPTIGEYSLARDALEDPELREAVEKHLQECRYCQMEAAQYGACVEVAKRELANHISSEEIVAFVNDPSEPTLSVEQKRHIEDHLLVCRHCRSLVNQLPPVNDLLAAFEAGEQLPLPEGWDKAREDKFVERLQKTLATQKAQAESDEVERNAPAAMPVAAGSARLSLTQRPKLFFVSLSAPARAGVAATLVALIALPFIYWLTRAPQPGFDPRYGIPYRSASGVALITPEDGATVGVYQEFRWQPVSSARGYTLTIRERATGRIVLQAPTMSASYLLIERDAQNLANAVQYEWFITARVDSTEVQSPTRQFTFTEPTRSLSHVDFPQQRRESLKARARSGNQATRDVLLRDIESYIAEHRGAQTPDRAWALGFRGFILYFSNKRNEAAASYREAITLWEAIGIPSVLDYAGSLINYALASQDAGHLDEALTFYQKASTLLRSRDEDDYLKLRSTCLLNLGTLYRLVGLPRQAQQVYQEALDIDRRLNNMGNVAEELGNIGNLLVDELGDPQSGVTRLEEAVGIHRAIAEREGEPRSTMADALDGLAVAYRMLGDPRRALMIFEEALLVDRRLENEAGVLATTNNVADLLMTELGDTHAALERYREALDIIARNDDANPDDVWRTYDGLGRAQLSLGNLAAAEEQFNKALETIYSLRSTLNEREFRQHFRALRTSPHYGIALLRTRQNDTAGLFSAIEAGRATTLREAGQRRVDNSGGNPSMATVSLADLQSALNDGEMALQYLFGAPTDRLILLAVTRNSATWYLLSTGKATDSLVRDVINGVLGGRTEIASEQGQLIELSRQLLPAALIETLRQQNINRVIISPDGSLNNLPLEALKIALRGDESDYLLRWFTISTVPSLSWWMNARHQWNATNNNLGDVLAIADPYIAEGGCRARSAIVNEYLAFRAAPDWSPLRFSRNEVNVVARYANHNSLVLRNHEAQSSRFIAAQPVNFKILHFATHALSGGTLDTSMLLFGCAGEMDVLNGSEIEDLELNGQLVVLSVCDASAGDTLSNEGNDSLMSGFLLAGAGCVVASRWRVRDDIPVELMETFYDQLSRGSTVDEALRTAKLRYLENTDNNPRAWAAFTALGYGDMRVAIQPTFSVKARRVLLKYWWVLALTALLLAAGAVNLIRRRYQQRQSSNRVA